MLLVLLRASLIRRSSKAFLLDDTCGVIERPTCDKALLSLETLDVKNETISWKLLSFFNLQDVAWFSISPLNRQESLDFPGDHQILNLLAIDLLGHFPLSQL
jgi:hypothetical protein